jgi:transposase
MAEEIYVGIDVSKAELVVAVRPSGERMTLANDRAGIKRLVGRLGELKPHWWWWKRPAGSSAR